DVRARAHPDPAEVRALVDALREAAPRQDAHRLPRSQDTTRSAADQHSSTPLRFLTGWYESSVAGGIRADAPVLRRIPAACTTSSGWRTTACQSSVKRCFACRAARPVRSAKDSSPDLITADAAAWNPEPAADSPYRAPPWRAGSTLRSEVHHEAPR